MRFLLAALLATTPIPTHGKWPEHGLYRVEAVTQHGRRLCRFRAEAEVDGKPFALVITDEAQDGLQVQLLA